MNKIQPSIAGKCYKIRSISFNLKSVSRHIPKVVYLTSTSLAGDVEGDVFNLHSYTPQQAEHRT